MKSCSIADCDRKFYARGLCSYHYQKEFRANNLLAYDTIPINIIPKELIRFCPKCNRQIIYKNIVSYNKAIKLQFQCRRCASDKFIKLYGTIERNIGSNNPFYGKTHTDETKNKLKTFDRSYTQTEEFKQKMSDVTSGNKNPMFNRTYYNIWLEKYGKEKADELQELKKKHNSIASSGSRNPMYGKPSPQGAGNGWSGWYKDWFFRSIRELSYVITVLEKENHTWCTAESVNLRIQYYDWENKLRNYYPDFFVDNQQLVEIKPKRLHISPQVLAKAKAAEEFCREHGYTYLLIDVEPLSDIEMYELYTKQLIKFTNKYEELFKLRLEKLL